MWLQISSEQMHIRSEQPPKNIKIKLANDEEIRPKTNIQNYFLKQYNDKND